MKRIPLNTSTFGDEETKAVLDALRSSRVTMGEKCPDFELAFGEYLGGAEAIFVNSRLSANLPGFFALANLAFPHPRNKRIALRLGPAPKLRGAAVLSYLQNHRRYGPADKLRSPTVESLCAI